MVDKLPVIQNFLTFLGKNERAVYFVIIGVLGYLVWERDGQIRELNTVIQALQDKTIEHERKKGAIFENIVSEQIRQQMIRDEMLKNKSE